MFRVTSEHKSHISIVSDNSLYLEIGDTEINLHDPAFIQSYPCQSET